MYFMSSGLGLKKECPKLKQNSVFKNKPFRDKNKSHQAQDFEGPGKYRHRDGNTTEGQNNDESSFAPGNFAKTLNWKCTNVDLTRLGGGGEANPSQGGGG